MTDYNELEKLKVFVCKHFRISEEEMGCRRRNRNVCKARDFYIWVARNFSNDHEDIAKTINRDRTTAWASIKRTIDQRKVYPAFKKELDGFEQEYKSINK